MENEQDGEGKGDCWSTAVTTVAMNECYYEELNIAEARLLAYLAGAREKFVDNVNSEYNRDSEADRVAAIAEFDDAQKEWERYRTNYCGSVYYSWKDGTIRGGLFFDMPDPVNQYPGIHNLAGLAQPAV